MRRYATVRVRVTLAAVVIVGLTFAAGAAWLVSAHRDSLTQNVETNARLRIRDIAATIADGTLTPILAVPTNDENLIQIIDSNGTIVSTSANIHGRPRISTTTPGSNEYITQTIHHFPVGDTPFLVVSHQVSTQKASYTIYVAGSLESVQDSTDSLTRLLLLGLPIMLVLVGAITWVVTGRALRPVASIRAEVEAIGAHDLHRRVPEPGTSDEIGRLARTMNAMLARLQDATDRQRRFVADASHELRSPLTGIRTQLEVDLAHPERADWQATERDVLDDTIRLQRLVDDLLVLARTDASAADISHREPVDLDEIVLMEARRLRSRSSHHVDTTGVSGAQINGNHDQLTRAVRNLLDNAARHTTSVVTVTLQETNVATTLVVSDDGPGIPAHLHADIFERFSRLDDARDRDAGGTGLGLAITRDVVTSHGGTITLENDHGARFTVTFPARDGATRA